MKFLPPQRLDPKYYTTIEKEINAVFVELIYRKLYDIMRLPKSELHNAGFSPLYLALADGKIEYSDGYFTGRINATIAAQLYKIGAKFDQKLKLWHLPHGDVPAELQIAQARADARYQNLSDQVLKALDSVEYENVLAASLIDPTYHRTINEMNAKFVETVQNVSIPPELTPKMRQIISQQWGNNLKKYIKDWSEENITELRQKVQANAFTGRRAENLSKIIQSNYGVSQRKARFLARQETSLLMSKFHETRYADVGIYEYKWSGSMDERERPDHKLLQGKIFRFDEPPVVDRKTGRRGNPGEDFGCRCVAIPVIK